MCGFTGCILADLHTGMHIIEQPEVCRDATPQRPLTPPVPSNNPPPLHHTARPSGTSLSLSLFSSP
jgi:hypothetical protein